MPSDSYSPGTKSFEVEDTYTPYKKKKFEEELEAIRKFQAEAAKANREEVVDDSQHTPMTERVMDDYVSLSLKLQNGDISFEEFDRLEAMEAERAKAYAANDTMGGTKEDYLIKNNPRVLLNNVEVVDKPIKKEPQKNIDVSDYLVDWPVVPDWDALREEQQEKHKVKLDPYERNFSDFANSIPELDPDQVIKDAVSRGMAKHRKEKWDEDYKEGLARWEAMQKKTPKFQVGKGVSNPINQEELNTFIESPEVVSLEGMADVINPGNTVKTEVVKEPKRDFLNYNSQTPVDQINSQNTSVTDNGGFYLDNKGDRGFGIGYRYKF